MSYYSSIPKMEIYQTAFVHCIISMSTQCLPSATVGLKVSSEVKCFNSHSKSAASLIY